MPPVGGFENVKYRRNLPFRGPSGLAILGGVTAVRAYGFYPLPKNSGYQIGEIGAQKALDCVLTVSIRELEREKGQGCTSSRSCWRKVTEMRT